MQKPLHNIELPVQPLEIIYKIARGSIYSLVLTLILRSSNTIPALQIEQLRGIIQTEFTKQEYIEDGILEPQFSLTRTHYNNSPALLFTNISNGTANGTCFKLSVNMLEKLKQKAKKLYQEYNLHAYIVKGNDNLHFADDGEVHYYILITTQALAFRPNLSFEDIPKDILDTAYVVDPSFDTIQSFRKSEYKITHVIQTTPWTKLMVMPDTIIPQGRSLVIGTTKNNTLVTVYCCEGVKPKILFHYKTGRIRKIHLNDALIEQVLKDESKLLQIIAAIREQVSSW